MCERGKRVIDDLKIEYKGRLIKGNRDLIDLIVITVAILIAILNTVLASGVFILVPLLVIIPFLLKLFFEDDATIIIVALALILLVSIILSLNFMDFPIPQCFLCIGFSLMAGNVIKRNYKDNKKKSIIVGITGLLVALAMYAVSFGNPIMYMKFKSNVDKYVKESYGDSIKIEKITIDWKNYSNKNLYVANVYEDSSDIYSGRLFTIKQDDEKGFNDSYCEDIGKTVGEKLSYNLEYLISKDIGINIKDINIFSTVNMKKTKLILDRKYKKGDSIEFMSITIGKDIPYNTEFNGISFYKSKEGFTKDAYKIIKLLNKLDYEIEELSIQSYIGDGQKWYFVNTKYIDGIKSIEDLENKVIVDSYENYKSEIELGEEE